MADRISKIVLSVVLAIAVLTGAWIGVQRNIVESKSKTIELVMDYSDVRTLAALSKYPLDKLLNDIKACGITAIGVKEETLSDAGTLGELFYSTGSGIIRNADLNPYLQSLVKRKLISPQKTYVMIKNNAVRKRVYTELAFIIPEKSIRTIGPNTFEINEDSVLLKDAQIGMSEALSSYLKKKGFSMIPRPSNDPRANVSGKIGMLRGSDIIIFDGDEILGYPDNINILAKALKRNGIKYGYVEIIKQDGDKKLKKLMGSQVIRVHSVPKDELKKISKDEAIDRFARAARERTIRLIYVRPFLPPQITDDPVKYNISYLLEIKRSLESAGYTLGKASFPADLYPHGWQILLLGTGVIIGFMLLVSMFIFIPWFVYWIIIFVSIISMIFFGAQGHGFMLEKYLAWLAAVTFPSYAVISQFGKPKQYDGKPYLDALYMVLNVVGDTAIGIFLIVGLLSNTSFMLATQEFSGVKTALLIPILLVAVYFFFKTDKGFDVNEFKARTIEILKTKFPVWIFLAGILALGVFAVLLARSGNFTIPVPGFEKAARTLLEKIMVIRPRTKEFLIGYPILIVSALLFLKGKKALLPILLAIGVIGPVSTLNSFCHIHTPVVISIIRSINGLVIGVLLGWLAYYLITKFVKE